MAAKPSFSIGIDLGTTYCCVAVLRDESKKPEVIQNDMGKNTTPSYVSFNTGEDEDEDEDVYAGDAAKDEAYQNPENTLFDIKRLIGRTFYDAHVQKYKHLWPFHLTEIHGLVAVKIGDKELLPQAISIHLISHLKTIAENYLGCSVDSAVVTIPVYYNELQQDVTRASCVKAGFKSVEFIIEPVAAALAYGLESSIKNKGAAKTCLIFDLGGGTFDITIFTLNANKQVEIKATGGDDRLGGEDFNDLLTEHCLKEFKKEHGIDLTEGKESEDDELRKKVAKRFRRIRSECERQKCFLTSTTKVVISLEGLVADTPMAVPVSRKLFEDLIASHLTRCLTIVGTVLRKAGLTKGDIDDVVLIGGSSRIPKVQTLLSDYFEGKRLHMSIDADEAVACGAAIHAYNTFHGRHSAPGIVLVQQEHQKKLHHGKDFEPEKNKQHLPHNPKFNRVMNVLDSLDYLNYKNKFIENEMCDALVEDCISDGSINSFLSDVIPIVGHRIQFVKTFSTLPTSDSTTTSKPLPEPKSFLSRILTGYSKKAVSANVKWVADSNGHWPEDAVKAGAVKGASVIVARVKHTNGDYTPGQLRDGQKLCYYNYTGVQYSSSSYEVLVAPPGAVEWIPPTKPKTQDSAVFGGNYQGQSLYVGRCIHKGDVNAGLISEFRGHICFIATGGTEIFCYTFINILCLTKSGQQQL